MYCKQILIIFCTLLLATQAFAVDRTIKRNTGDGRQRIALVIGNAAYKSGPLRNPVNDARAMAAALEVSGFQVELLQNANQRRMEDAIRGFGKRLRNGGVGLFYFAGHGIQYQGSNYMIPVGADIEDEVEVKYSAVNAGLVLGKMELAGNDVNIVILDACRNNPYGRSFRSATRGLARMDAPTGSLVAYATAPGSVAADGSGGNGIYTKHLLKYINLPGLTIEQVFKRVRKAVLRETDNKQTPWESSSLTGNFYFRGGGSMQVDAPEPDPQPGTITGSLVVKTEPSGAKVWVDEGYEGRSPVTIDSMLPGLVSVRAGKDGYENAAEKVRIRAGRRSELTLLLGKEAELAGRLFVEPTPTDALIRVLNIGPRYHEGMELAGGRYTVEVSSEGYVTATRTVELAAGEDLQVAVVLEKQKPKGPKAGATWTEASTGMEFVFVPGGCFQMGDTFGGGDADERPVHEVCLDSFWIGRYEVTQGQWVKLMGSNPSNFKKGNDYPVETVSWHEAVEYVGRLSSRGSKTFRLPTEAQWEYAARSGGKQEKYSGSNSPDYVAWYDDNSNSSTHRVGTKQANGLGLHDMSGNVWEWCSDWYGENYYSSSPRTNPQGPSSGSYRVNRGGGWDYPPWLVRSAGRGRSTPGDRNGHLGFRLVFPEGSR